MMDTTWLWKSPRDWYALYTRPQQEKTWRAQALSSVGIQVFGSDSELAKKIAEAIGSSGKPIAVSFAATDPTAGAMRVETLNSRLPHEATVLAARGESLDSPAKKIFVIHSHRS